MGQSTADKSALTPMYSSTPHILGPNPLWNKPGFKLPDYIENVTKGLMESGMSRERAIPIAIGVMRRWAAGEGSGGRMKKVTPVVRAAAAKALAEWEKLKAEAAADRARKKAAAAETRKNADMDMTAVFAPIVKSAPQDDGSLVVYGRATDSTLDLDEQRCDPRWLARAMPEWFSIGNIREQHDPKRAVGKATEYEDKGDDGHWITARIVDPVARAKTEAGVFTGFSIGIKGPRIAKSVDAPGGIVTDGKVVEVSLVDRPANPACTLQLVKSVAPGWSGVPGDFDEERGLVRVEELVEKADDPDEGPDADLSGHEDLAAPTPPPGEGAEGELGADAEVEPEPFLPAEDAAPAADEPPADTQKAERDQVYALARDILDKGVAPALAKADGGDDEASDIDGARQTIGTIAKLIASESTDLPNSPREAVDIQLLLKAASALEAFMARKQNEQNGGDLAAPEMAGVGLGADADTDAPAGEVAKAEKYSAEQKRKLMKQGKAIPNANGEPSFPIADGEDLKNAMQAIGRAGGDTSKVKAHIKRRAQAMGLTNMLTDAFKDAEPQATKDAEPQATKDAEPELAKAITEQLENNSELLVKALTAALADTDSEVLAKAVTVVLDKEDHPIRKALDAVIKAAIDPTAEALSELSGRMETVEKMAAPGGPVLRRTESERNKARVADLRRTAAEYRTWAQNADDDDLRQGWYRKAAEASERVRQLEAAL